MTDNTSITHDLSPTSHGSIERECSLSMLRLLKTVAEARTGQFGPLRGLIEEIKPLIAQHRVATTSKENGDRKALQSLETDSINEGSFAPSPRTEIISIRLRFYYQ